MKTLEETLYVLTELEILKIDLDGHTAGVAGEINTVDLSKFKTLNQSHPSISAEEFLKEKGIDFGKHGIIETKEGIVELLTEFASRQGKVVEPE